MDKKHPKRLLDLVCNMVRFKHQSIHTEKAYVKWIIRFILSLNKRYPKEIGNPGNQRISGTLGCQRTGGISCPKTGI